MASRAQIEADVKDTIRWAKSERKGYSDWYGRYYMGDPRFREDTEWITEGTLRNWWDEVKDPNAKGY